VQPSPARADAPDGAWLPVPPPDSLPSVEELLEGDGTGPPADAAPRDLPIAARGPGRAAPHDETAWLPLPEVEDLPPIAELLESPPGETANPAALRDITAEPSPARAEPADAATWLPLPAVHNLPDLPELDPEGADPDPPTPRSKPRRRRRRLREHLPRRGAVGRLFVFVLGAATLVGVYYGGSSILDQGADVRIRADGRVIDTETGVRVVASVLQEQHVSVGDFDRVLPSPVTSIVDGMTIKVVRAFPVNADVDGSPRTLYTSYHTRKGFLRDASRQIGVSVEKLALRNAPRRVQADDSLLLRTKRIGTLLVDTSAVNYNSPSDTIAELLEQYKVVLGPTDYIRLNRSDKTATPADELPDNESVEIVRVLDTTDRVLEEYSLPDERRPDPNLEVGLTRTVAARKGTRWVTYGLELHDGREVGRTVISVVPAKRARPHIDYYGSKYNPLWDKMAFCETGGRWDAPGPEYQGGLGIYFQTWNRYGGRDFAPNAGQATKLEQIIVAERIREAHGWHAWGCAKIIGL
jgi:resuscitation-promoting factor RpfB